MTKLLLPVVIVAVCLATACTTDQSAHDEYWRRFTSSTGDSTYLSSSPSTCFPASAMSDQKFNKEQLMQKMSREMNRQMNHTPAPSVRFK